MLSLQKSEGGFCFPVLQDGRGAFNHNWLCVSPAVSKQLTSHAVCAHTPRTFWKWGGFHPLPPLHLFSPSLITEPFTWPVPVKISHQQKATPFFVFFCLFYFFFLFSVLLCLCFLHPGCCAALAESTVRWWVESAKWGRHSLERGGRSEAECANQQVRAGRGFASLSLCPKMHFTHLLKLILWSAADKP